MKRLSALLILLFSTVVISTAGAEDYGVYVKVSERVGGTFDEVVKNTEGILAKNGWHVLASYASTAPEGCGFRAHTIVINSPEYARKIMSHGPYSSFALPLRVGIFTDEKGTNITFMNPASINRTVLGDNVEKDLSVSKMKELSSLLAQAARGTVVNRQAGEIRSEGYVGGMGGGAFGNKITEIYKKEDIGSNFHDIVSKVKDGITGNTKGWRLVYTIDLGNEVIYGIDKQKTEARAFHIAGEKRETKSNPCPGIDHSPAFPIEVVVLKDRGMVKVLTLDEMYRMKVYFEDAGKWAFMKNMGMPGEIEKEIVEISGSKLR